jgi:hypothetical protein
MKFLCESCDQGRTKCGPQNKEYVSCLCSDVVNKTIFYHFLTGLHNIKRYDRKKEETYANRDYDEY